MGTEITVFTVEKMQEIIDATIVDAEVLADDLVLHRQDGTTIDVGNVRGPAAEGGGGRSPWPARMIEDDYTLTLDDAFTYIEGISVLSDTPYTLTVPPAADVPFEDGTIIKICQQTEGLWTLVGAGEVLLMSLAGKLTTGGQYSECQLRKRSGDYWVVSGSLQDPPPLDG